jgi:rRNA-processing protein FCF1
MDGSRTPQAQPQPVTARGRVVRREALLVDDPAEPPTSRSEDPGDDCLLALAEAERAVLVSGDRHLLRAVGVGLRRR